MQKNQERRWTQTEKEQLVALCERHQVNNRIKWDAVAAELGTKTAKQCKTQFSIVLKCRTEKVVQQWSQLEYATLVLLVAQHGRKWAFLQKTYFPHRDADNIRIKYTSNFNKQREAARTPSQLWEGAPDFSHPPPSETKKKTVIKKV